MKNILFQGLKYIEIEPTITQLVFPVKPIVIVTFVEFFMLASAEVSDNQGNMLSRNAESFLLVDV